MYEPSANFYTTVVQAQARRITWGGTITAGGVDYPFTAENISADTGTITNEISGSVMEIGTAYSSELDIGLYIDDIGVPRDKIYDALIAINCTITAGETSGTVPMGVFKVTEAKQSGAVCSIVAYDLMSLFDVEYPIESGAQTPYEWALTYCESCGVYLGTTEEEFHALPNSELTLLLTWEDSIDTYRTALGMLAAAVGCSAHFDREGLLRFYPLTSKSSVATIKANDRFSSGIAQTSWRPSSIYVTNTATGVVTKRGNGRLMLNLNDNAFLQSPGGIRDTEWRITEEVSVDDMLDSILSRANNLVAVPIDASIPLDPCLDLFDIATLTGGQANNTQIIITSISHTIGGATSIKCAGSNTSEEPKTSSKSGSNKDEDFWITSDLSDEIRIGTKRYTWGFVSDMTWAELGVNTWREIIEGGNLTLIALAEFQPPKEMNNGVMSFTVNYTLTEDTTITYYLIIDEDGEDAWTVTETQKAGRIAKTITTPIQIWSRSDRVNQIKVYMAGVADDSN